MNDEDIWYKNAVFYEVYIRAFYDGNADGNGDLRGLIEKLDYLNNLGVDCIWLMPIFTSPLIDDGYDIADYYTIHPDYGTLEDFKSLLDAVHARGMRLITDLVLNHTSDQHSWFQAAREGKDSPYHEYYVWSDTPEKYQKARIIFIDTEPSNWTWDDVARRYYWHRFYSCQPDLNFDNPAVQQEMFDVVKFWLDLGVDGFRADAVPYLFERDGTNCENLPKTHAFLKRLRAFIDEYYPDRILLCEANQWPQDVRPYFGNGDEFHMGFHFPLMPRIYMAIRKSDISPLAWVMERTPPIPGTCQWCTFLRNHDELTLEMVTEEERQWMWEEFAPEPRMRLNLGIRRRLAPLLDNDLQKIGLAHSLLFTLPGSPILYYGDEIGMGDNIWLADRNGVRTPMQWDSSVNAGFSSAERQNLYSPVISEQEYSPQNVNVSDQINDQSSLYNIIRQMIHVRKNNQAFAWGNFRWAEDNPGSNNKSVAVYWRESEDQKVLILNNLTGTDQRIQIPVVPEGLREFEDLLDRSTDKVPISEQFVAELAPFQYRWLRLV